MIAIPDSYKEVLNRVQARYPSAFIAGGCLRDLFWERPVKDIDIWVPVTSVEDAQDTHSGVSSIFPPASLFAAEAEESFQIHTITPEYVGISDRRLVSVYEVRCDSCGSATLPRPINIIFIEGTQESIVNEFDMSFCYAAYDGAVLDIRQPFLDTADTHVVTVLHPNRHGNRQEQRIERMKEKYPDFQFVDTDGESV